MNGETITIGPYAIFFTNVNTQMKLAGHSHYAEVSVTFRTLTDLGFPVFSWSVDPLVARLRLACERPWRDAKNEDVARGLMTVAITHLTTESRAEGYGEGWDVAGLELAVRGVPDRIEHSDGFARYYTPGHLELVALGEDHYPPADEAVTPF